MHNHFEKIVIIGATSTIAEYCARLWAQRMPKEFILVGRNLEKLNMVSDDLKVRTPQTHITVLESNFTQPSFVQETISKINAAGKIDLVLIAHGTLLNQKNCEQNLDLCHESLTINGVSPILFAEGFANIFEKQNHGTLAIIGSVAGDRGKKSNYIYGAAKCMLSCYGEGLQHRFSKTNVKVTLIKPGPTSTAMTAHLVEQGQKLASVEQVAKKIVQGIERRKSVIYAPQKWKFIMWIIRSIPKKIFYLLEI